MTLRTGVEPMDGQPIVGVPIKRALPVLIYHIFDKKDDWSFTRCSKSLNNRYLFSSQRKLLQKFQCREIFQRFWKKIGLAFNMEYLIPVLLLWTSICVTLVHSIDFPVSEKYSTCPKKCDLSKCKKLSYCGGTIRKDECGCCQICSSDTWIHPKVSSVKQGGACEQVKCPKMKVCMENMQGLPLCTCPNLFICRRSNKQVCGSDDNTYQSRCHMRVASCTLGKRIRVKHKGACGMVATEHSGANKYPDGEFDIRSRRRKERKLEKKKRRLERQRRKRRNRKKARKNKDKKSKSKNKKRRKRRHNRHNKRGLSKRRTGKLKSRTW